MESSKWMLDRARRRAWLLLALVLLPAWAAASEPLKIGLLPVFSTRALINLYQPLQTYLERELQRPVVLLTAPDFRAFYRDIEAGQYDVALNAAHLARLAQLEKRMKPIVTYDTRHYAVLIMAKARPVRALQELRGRTLAIFDPLALVVLQALEWLAEQGLEAGRDYRVLHTPSHHSVAYSVRIGESLLGVTSPVGLARWTDDMRENLQVFANLSELTALVWTIHPRLGDEGERRIKTALLRLPATPEGKQLLADLGYHGIREVSAEELRAMDPYARRARDVLRAQP